MNVKRLAAAALLLTLIAVFFSCRNDTRRDDGISALTGDSDRAAPVTGETEMTTAAHTAETTCNPVTTAEETEQVLELLPFLKDPCFKRGVSYTRLDVALPAGRLSYSLGSPSWLYTQEQSRYDISKGSYSSPETGVHVYEDASKYLYLDTNTGMFRMGIKGSKEYDHPRRWDERWTGALITPTVVDKIFVRDFAALSVTLDFVLDEVTNHMNSAEFNRDLHSAQWNYYLFVQDSTSTSWFMVGLPLYDYRGTGETEYISIDPGTGGTFVYIPTYDAAFGDARAEIGRRFTQTADLLPFIDIAFDIAREKGFLTGCDLDNFFISGCNLGWEIPGIFDCMATVYEFSMSYALK
ncbi:MAG: hypothetical protein J5830_06390 [Clostridia bacterium]|nr:hypothetical protein [Clostridia bacterium]